MYKAIISGIMCFGVLGCSAVTFEMPRAGLEDGGYRTSSEIDPDSIITYKTYPGIEDVEFVVLLTFNDQNNEAYNTFIRSSLLAIGFKSVISELEFINRVKEKKLEATIDNVYDWNTLDNLHTLNSEFPRFLVIESLLTNGGRASSTFLNKLRVIDPRAPEVLVDFNEVGTYWLNLEKEFAYPSVNFLYAWHKQSL